MRLRFVIVVATVLAISLGVGSTALFVRLSLHPPTMKTYEPDGQILFFRQPPSYAVNSKTALGLAWQYLHCCKGATVTANFGLFRTHGSRGWLAWVVSFTGHAVCPNGGWCQNYVLMTPKGEFEGVFY